MRVPAGSIDVPVLGWAEFLSSLDWRQGEHVSMVGPTGEGKTTLALALLPRRKYVVVLATKPKDRTLEKLIRSGGFRRVTSWPPPMPASLMPRVVLWPKWKTPADTPKQAVAIKGALDGVFGEGNWCVYADELYYLCELLGLSTYLRLLWQQGRSIGLSLVGGTQRPAWVPLEMYSQATHVFFFSHNDRRDLDRIGGVGKTDPSAIRHLVTNLDNHSFLYLNTRSGAMAVSKVER